MLKGFLYVALAVMLTVRGAPAAGEAAILDHEYRDFAAVLEATVDETGNVDYRALNSDPSRLQQCLSLMSRVHASDYQQWSREQRLAYLINLYNAHTIGLIARHYPVKTIKDIGNLWQGPWGQPVVLLFGRRTSLDYLANKLIHPLFDDPRIYFALCFGAASSPMLRREPYVATGLDRQFDEQCVRFFHDPRNLEVSSDGFLIVSEMIKWHARDLGAGEPEQRAFIGRYAPGGIRAIIESGSGSFAYRKFDWSLNEKRR